MESIYGNILTSYLLSKFTELLKHSFFMNIMQTIFCVEFKFIKALPVAVLNLIVDDILFVGRVSSNISLILERELFKHNLIH